MPSDVTALKAVVWQATDLLARGEVPDAAIEELKVALRTRYTSTMATNQFWADSLAEAYMFGTPVADIVALPDLAADTTRNSLANAARRYLRKDEYLDAVWSPQ